MSWLLLLLGLVLAFVSSAGAAALVTSARVALAEAIARRLRGAQESLAWIAVTERQVMAATSAASFGVALAGAAIPGVFSDLTVAELGVVVVLIGVPVTLLGGYLLPRWLTLPRAERVVEQLGALLAGLAAILGWVLPASGTDPADEIRALTREGSASGVGGEELVMVGGVMTFAVRPVKEVMTPRTDVVAIPQDAAYADVERTFAESGYTRLPVYGATLDEIVGMLHAFDLFKHQAGDVLPLRPVSFAPELRPAGDALLDMQRERQHLAVVVDEFGGTAGIVTLDDLLGALVGEIADEDDAPVTTIATAAVLEADAAMSPSAVGEHFGIELPRGEAVSFVGLLAELLGRIPATGERFALRGLEIDVLAASPTRVERVLVRRDAVAPVVIDRVGG
ncbi:MAG TPA: CBS domain-containing protein [Gemmatimonadales bacterium]|jgi:CBS domain containing-hemolysin-like protein